MKSGRQHRAWNLVFAVLLAVHLLPLLTTRWFPTLDGPCHLNNARILLELVKGNGTFRSFFSINPYPEPNWLGHALMAVAMSAFPAWLAEKSVQVLALTGLALAFRHLMAVLAPERPWTALLVMPFLLCFTFVMGFINFSLGLSLLLLVLAMHERAVRDRYGRPVWPLAFFLLLLYLAHLQVFAVGVILVCARAAWALAIDQQEPRGTFPQMFRHLFAMLVLPCCLTVGYFIRHGDHVAAPSRVGIGELLRWVTEGRAWNTLVYDAELPWTRIIALGMLFLALAGIFFQFRRDARGWRSLEMFWPAAALLVFVLYLLLPDSMAGGSFASPRLLLFFMLMVCAWVGVASIPKRMSIGLIAIICSCDLVHLCIQQRIWSSLEDETRELLGVSDAVPEGAVLLPLNYGDNWLHSNLSNYLGAERKAIVLDNFVATAPFSPVRWREERSPYASIGNFDGSNRPCVHLHAYQAHGEPLIDHVLTWKLNDTIDDSCTKDVRAQLRASFVEVAVSPMGDAHLYRRR